MVQGKMIAAALASLILVAALAPAGAAGSSHADARRAHAGGPFGILPTHGSANANAAVTGGPLRYNGGDVMHASENVLIFWNPAGYTYRLASMQLISTFISDELLTCCQFQEGYAGPFPGFLPSTVFWPASEYPDKTMTTVMSSQSSWGGAEADNLVSPYPASGCHDRYTSVCLTDRQIRAVVRDAALSQGAQGSPTGGLRIIYDVFLPANVGDCFGGLCAYTNFCGYHGTAPLVGHPDANYMVIPDAGWVPQACSAGQSPNGDSADWTLSSWSHEEMETFTDPHGDGWFDRRGSSTGEIGDKCSYVFGAPLGQTVFGEFNQLIGNPSFDTATHYWLQGEWSNVHSRCVFHGR